MRWKIELRPTAEKHYEKLDKKTLKKVKKALRELEKSKDPASLTNVSALTVTLYGDYGLEVGDWRLLFTPDEMTKKIHVYGIYPRDELQ